MCPNRSECISLQHRLPKTAVARRAIQILVFIFTMLFSALFAADYSDEYRVLLRWQLPDNAVEISTLSQQEELLYIQEKPFSGWAYELYPDGELLSASQYKNGRLHGAKYLWYPGYLPQMSAFYRNGVLEGRFLGWYATGSVIYDLYLKHGTFGGDYLLESDENRIREESEIYEGEGRDNDDSHD